jgi:biopolymer transport protein ExbD
VVSLNKDLQLFLDNKPVSRETLSSALRVKVAQGEATSVELHVDGTIAYQHVVRLMATVQDAGITKLSFVTLPVK